MIQTPRMPSQMGHKFSEIPAAHIQRSSFNRPAECHTAHNAGDLIPFYVEEVLPGDTHTVNAKILSRLFTPIKPFMSNLYMDTFFFFVPNRLVWNNWEKFNGAQTDPDDSTDYTLPLMYLPASTGWVEESLQDYLDYGLPGIAGNASTTFAVHNLVGRGYNLIWNEYFRDQNMQDSRPVDKDDGPDAVADYSIQKRGKRHDYFTSALPWPQKGDSLALFLTGSAPVYGNAMSGVITPDGYSSGYHLWQTMHNTGAATTNTYGALTAPASTANPPAQLADQFGGGTQALWNDSAAFQKPLALATEAQYTAYNAASSNSDAVPPYVDLSSATSNTINEFRTAFQLQMLLENDARGGTRYVEILHAHFGVISPDFRLQRPEYLGGNSSPLIMSSVPQTAITGTTPQGNLAAYALFQSNRNGFTKSFVEHGYIIGLMSVRSDLSYQQGVERHYLRRTRFDYYWPAFAHLGEQAITNQEIYQQGVAGGTSGQNSDFGIFGYQERFAEYRYKNSTITGKMRSTSATSLDVWHLAQEFSALPTLDPTFIVENPPIARVVATTTEPHFKTDVYMDIRSARPMPIYSVPGLITRL